MISINDYATEKCTLTNNNTISLTFYLRDELILLETASVFLMIHFHRLELNNISSHFGAFLLHFRHHKNREAEELGPASRTSRHLIFRLYSIKLGGCGQLMSTMTFSSISATAPFNHGWLGRRGPVTGQTGGGSLLHDWMLQLLVSLISSAALGKLQRQALFVIRMDNAHTHCYVYSSNHQPSPISSFSLCFFIWLFFPFPPCINFPLHAHTRTENTRIYPLGALQSRYWPFHSAKPLCSLKLLSSLSI